MLGLRMAEGLDDDSFREAFGYGFFEKYEKRLSPFLAAGLVLCEGKKTALNARGMAVSNTILAKILED
jgi:coproporphyrinogen III oxidase-like Fe-S oxidoreductase